MKEQDRWVAQTLNEKLEARKEAVNQKRREPTALQIGSKVWYQPERQPGTDKLEPRWKGPAVVLERVGDHSYVVELQPGKRQPAHRSQLKPHMEDLYSTTPVPLYFWCGKAQELEVGPDEWEVERVLNHRHENGKTEFLVRWKGFGPEEDQWEPLGNFFFRINKDVVAYCVENGVDLDVKELLELMK
jgi:hypothetical protein